MSDIILNSPHQLTNARLVGRVNNKPVYRFHVRVYLNDSRECDTIGTADYSVLSHSAADACNLIRDEWAHRPETEIKTKGAKGGKTVRYVGYESAIWHGMMQGPRYSQNNLWS